MQLVLLRETYILRGDLCETAIKKQKNMQNRMQDALVEYGKPLLWLKVTKCDLPSYRQETTARTVWSVEAHDEQQGLGSHVWLCWRYGSICRKLIRFGCKHRGYGRELRTNQRALRVNDPQIPHGVNPTAYGRILFFRSNPPSAVRSDAAAYPTSQ